VSAPPFRCLPALLVGLGLGLAAGARADAGFSCGARVVTTGMGAGAVRAACAAPAEVRRTSIRRRATVWRAGRPVDLGGEVEVPVESWVYDFGPNTLMRRLRFEDGRLAAIDTLGYGRSP
jgi:hypothetical protein